MMGTPQDSCNYLLQTLRESNLNFLVSETPFSVQICVRKKFVSNAPMQKSSIMSTDVDLDEKMKSLVNENAELVTILEKANKTMEDLKMANEVLHSKVENAEKEVFKVCKEKKELEAKIKNMKKSDEIAIYKTKVKSLEKSVKAKELLVDTAHETIANLEAEMKVLKISKLKPTGYPASELRKDANENILESFPIEFKSNPNNLNLNIPPSLMLPVSPAREGALTTLHLSSYPSPHTPPGSPPKLSKSALSSSLQHVDTVGTSSPAALSCYFEESPLEPVEVKKTNPDSTSSSISLEYVKRLSKLNLGPRQRRNEDT